MNTVLLWLLIAAPISNYGSSSAMPHVVERFTDVAQCEVVARAIREVAAEHTRVVLRCVQARVAVPER